MRDREEVPNLVEGVQGETRKPRKGVLPGERAIALRVLARLSKRTGRDYTARPDPHVRHISARLRAGYTEDDLRLIVWHKANAWLGNERMEAYVRPSTLFSKLHFPEYLVEARAAWEERQKRVGGTNGHVVLPAGGETVQTLLRGGEAS